MSQQEFSTEQIDTFAKQLYDLFYLSISDFYEFCKTNKLKVYALTTPLQSLEQYSLNRFKEIEDNIDSIVIRSTVIISKQGIMYFYDFEHATIATSPGLADIKIHGKFNKEQSAIL